MQEPSAPIDTDAHRVKGDWTLMGAAYRQCVGEGKEDAREEGRPHYLVCQHLQHNGLVGCGLLGKHIGVQECVPKMPCTHKQPFRAGPCSIDMSRCRHVIFILALVHTRPTSSKICHVTCLLPLQKATRA
jgi:hypothetical protein